MKFKKIKLRTKIVLSIFIITSFGGIVSYLYFSEQFKEIKINGLVEKSRTIILSAETAREFSTDQFNHNIFKDSLKTVEEVLYTVPIFSAMEVAKKKADELGFTLKIPKNSPRNPDNHPDKFEKRVLKILGDKEVEEYWKIDEKTNSLRFFRPVVLTEDCMRCHGDPAKSFEYWGRTDGKDITGTKMEGWNVGEVHGAFEIFVDMKPIMAELNEKLAFISYFFAFLVIFLTGIGYLLSRMVNKEITTMNNLIKSLSNDISNGILDNKIDQNKVGVDFKDVTLDINNLVDTFVKPFKLTSDLINRISKGRKVNLIEEDYKGEFGNLKDSINNLIIVNDEITNSFRVISSGDLTKRLKVRSSEDELSISTNEIIDSISYTLGNIVNKFKRISSDIDLMSSNSDSLSSSIQEKSFQTDEIAAAMEEMSHTINQNAQSAETTSDMANINKGVASEGVEIVNESISKMKEISDVVENTANIITNLGNKSTEISKIISVIDDIADQTNMLALNAAIEAARAGEQGRGFAVVADEVRKLAERTSNATKDIETMIKEIQLVTKNAVSSMENGINEVNNGITLSNSAGRSLNKIFESSDNLLDMITSIVSATQEQASTSEEIARNVSDISIVISNSAKQIADNAELAERIRDFIYELEKEISKFKFDENIQNSNKSNEELGNKIESLNNRYLN